MKPSQKIRQHQQKIQELAQQFGMKNLRIFGSVAKGEDTENSDLDLLVEASPQPHFLIFLDYKLN